MVQSDTTRSHSLDEKGRADSAVKTVGPEAQASATHAAHTDRHASAPSLGLTGCERICGIEHLAHTNLPWRSDAVLQAGQARPATASRQPASSCTQGSLPLASRLCLPSCPGLRVAGRHQPAAAAYAKGTQGAPMVVRHSHHRRSSGAGDKPMVPAESVDGRDS